MKKYKKFLACIALIGCMQECKAEYAFATSGTAIAGSSMATIASGKKGWAFAADFLDPFCIQMISAWVSVIILLQSASHYDKSPHEVASLAKMKKESLLKHLNEDIDGMQDNDPFKDKDPFVRARKRAVQKDIDDYAKLLEQYPSQQINYCINACALAAIPSFIAPLVGRVHPSKNTTIFTAASASLAVGLQLYNSWNSRKVSYKILEMDAQDYFLEMNNMNRAQNAFNVQKAEHMTYYPQHVVESKGEKLHEQGGYVVPSNDNYDDRHEAYAWHLTRGNLKTCATYDWTKEYSGLPEITYRHTWHHPEAVCKVKYKGGNWDNFSPRGL